MKRLILSVVLLAAACTGEPIDTDPADTGPAAPMINIIGEWWLGEGERLPTQVESWCEDLVPDRFDDGRCFTAPTACEQGILFDTPNNRAQARWLVRVQGTECNNDLPIEVWASSAYGSFEWLGRDETGNADKYRVNAREWIVQSTEGETVVVQSEDQTWTMVEDYRFEF